jgi:hypothetical protein
MPDGDLDESITVCSRCRTENFSFASFCISCGEPLGGPETEQGGLIDSAPEPANPLLSPQSTVLSPRIRRREAVLGLLVLALVVGYALYDWQRSMSESKAYKDGAAAALNKDWDTAAASFDRAGGLRDAPKRTADARLKVETRDKLYSQALGAAGRFDWLAVAAGLEQLQLIQPAYRDSESLLEQARWKAHMGGIVYLVRDGPSPGLYLIDPQGRSFHLPGSDKDSLVRAMAPNGLALVYDRPAREVDFFIPPLTKPATPGQDPPGSQNPQRIPVLARLSNPQAGVITYTPLARLASDGTGVFSDQGLWWYSRPPGGGLVDDNVFYYSPYLSDPWTPVQVSGLQPGKRVIALDPPRSRVIIAERVGGLLGRPRETLLYIADATGANPQHVHLVSGDVERASVSPDGRRLLYTTQEDGTGISRAVWVAHLDGDTAQSIETTWPQQVQTLSWSGLDMNEGLAASWLPAGTDPAPRVIVSLIQPSLETLTVQAADAFQGTYAWRGVPDGGHEGDLSAFSHNGVYLASRRQHARQATLYVIGTAENVQFEASAPLPALPEQTVKMQFSPGDNYVIAVVRNRDGVSRGTTQDIYAARLDNDHRLEAPRRIAIADMPYTGDFPTLVLPGDGAVIAYISAGRQLHAVSLDGAHDTLVAGSADAVWSLGAGADLSWWR